jgi:hypothetical protein
MFGVCRVDLKGKKTEGGYMRSESSNYKRITKYTWPRTSSSKLLLVLICLLMVVPVAFCQGVSGHILGSVKDSSDAVVSNAVVTVTNQDTGFTTKITTGSSGDYRADNLPPGNYQVRVEASGFRDAVSNGNVVTVDVATRVDVTLDVGSATESVEVEAANSLVDSTSSSLGEVINQGDISNLPLNGRIYPNRPRLRFRWIWKRSRGCSGCRSSRANHRQCERYALGRYYLHVGRRK